jgi:hypothetical protein
MSTAPHTHTHTYMHTHTPPGSYKASLKTVCVELSNKAVWMGFLSAILFWANRWQSKLCC